MGSALPNLRRTGNTTGENLGTMNQFISPAEALMGVYGAMSTRLGPMRWWPAKTPFEVIVGAILTQNTAWTNVERAIEKLRKERVLSMAAVEKIPVARLGRLIRSSGYFRQKAKKLKAFVRFVRNQFGGSLKRMFAVPTMELREKLLGVHGIGPETADSILLYAGNHPIFVVDAYTRRIMTRHGILNEKNTYDEIRTHFEKNLPQHARLYNEYHALIVNTGKYWCRTKNPICAECPLGPFLPHGSPLRVEPQA
jgi:endonuclease III related protein